MSTGPTGEVLRRPRVAFTTDRGERVVGVPAVYRTSTRLTNGTRVRVSYSARNPARIVVHGYDFRKREPLYAVLGILVAVVISVLYFEV